MPPTAPALYTPSVTKYISVILSLIFGLLFCGLTVNAQSISNGSVAGQINTCVGIASIAPNVQQFYVNGSGLTDGVFVTAPANFEVSSTPGGPYSSGYTIPRGNGQVSATVYVRSAAIAPVGNLTGNVMLNSAGATGRNVQVNATVTIPPTVNPVADQKVVAGTGTNAINFTGTADNYAWTNDQPGIGLAANGVGNIATFKPVNKTGATVTATITVTPKPADYLYIVNYMDGMVDAVNINTNKVTSIPVGAYPRRTVLARDGKYVFVSSWSSSNVVVIDPATKRAIKFIPVRANPLGMALSLDGTRLYVTSETTKDLTVIDTRTLTVEKYIPIGVLTVEAILSPDGKYLYAGMSWTHGKTVALNIATEQVDATLDVSLDEKAQFSDDGKNLFSTDRDANLYMISNVGIPTAKIINVTAGGMRIGLTADRKFVYATHEAPLGYISVFSTSTGSLISNIPNKGLNLDIASSPDSKYIYVVSFSNVLMIDVATHTIKKTFTFRGEGDAIAVSPDGTRVYVGEKQRFEVHAIDVATGTVSNIPSNILSHFSNDSFRMGTGCVGQPITFKITVEPPPSTLTVSPIAGSITACPGSPSLGTDIIQFTATGKDLTGDIKAVAPAGFEVSLSKDKNFAATVSIPQVNGDATAMIYVRSAAAAGAATISGNVVLSTGGSADVKVLVTALIKPLPTVDPITDQQVAAGSMAAAVNFTGTGQRYDWTNDHPEIGLAPSGSGNIAPFKTANTTGLPIIANITVTPKPAANLYILEDNSQNLRAVSTANNRTVANISTEGMPRRVVMTKDRKHIYVTNLTSNSVTLIDAVENKVIRTYTGMGQPVDAWITPDERKMYVSNRDGNTVAAIDLTTNTVLNYIGVMSMQNATGVMSPDAERLYLSGSDNVTVINTKTDRPEVVITAPGNYGGTVLLSPDGSRLYVPDKNGNIIVIDTKFNRMITSIPVAPDLTTLYMSPDGSRLYITGGYDGHLYTISTQSNTVIGDVNIGAEISSAVISPDGKFVYMTSYYHDHLTIFNTANNAVEKIPAVTTQALRPVLSNDGTRLYVVGGFGELVVVDLASKTVVDRTTVYGNTLAMGAELGCTGDPVTFKIRVDPPPPSIVANGNLSAMRTTYGTASQASSVSVSGFSLSEPILVTPPAGFEVSLDNVNFGRTVKAGAAGNAGPLNVYIRLAATTNAGSNYTGDVLLSSANLADVNVPVPTSIVDRAPLTVEGTFTKVYGDNTADYTAPYNAPGITFTVTGLKNGETFKSVDVSYGSFAAPSTAVNTYNNAVTLKNFSGDNGYLAANYTIDLKLSTLKVTPAPLTITANNVDKYYGDALTAVNGSTAFSAIGLKNNERIGTIDITYGSGAAIADPVNVYPGSVTPANAKGDTFNPANYTITYQTGHINVRTAPPATITVITRPSGVNTIYGDASTASSFNISAMYLLAPVTIAPPAGFEASTDGLNFGSTATVGSLGALASTTVHIRLAGKADAGPYSGAITLKSTVTAVNVSMPVSTVSPRPITLKAEDHSRAYGTALGNYAGQQRYSIVNGALQNGNTISSININYSAGNNANSPVNKYTGAASVGNVIGGHGYLPGNYTISRMVGDVFVTPAPLVIKANTVNKNYGEAISGSTTSTEFTQVGLMNGESIAGISTAYGAGAAANANAGPYPASVVASNASGGTFTATNYTISYESGTIEVAKIPLTVSADNKTRMAGAANPPLTFTYSGFIPGETEAVLTAKPIAVTTASVGSQAGKYPITLGGGSALNYSFIYVDGVLTVEPLKIFNPATLGLPNAFTPNNDNINDTWNLPSLKAYPKCTVNIYDRFGRVLFTSVGYGKAWDGTFNGTALPMATYYYTIDLKNGERPVAGNVTLIR